jgi:heme a synthase
VPRLIDWLPDSIDARVRGIAWASLAVQIGIVATGGAVRLTGSGLGCPTWPRCTPETFIVMPAQGIHGAIEFGNRLLTFVLTAVALLAVLFVWKLRRSRPDLWRLSLVLAAGIPAQAALGGLTVLTGLNPWLVGAHFIVSAALVSVAAVLVVRVLDGPPPRERRGTPLQPLAYAAATAVAITLVVGVVTTGAGPHAGDAATPRNGLDLVPLQHLHSYPAYAMLALTSILAALVHRAGLYRVRTLVTGLLALQLAQIAVGVTQARLGVPALLVGVHMVLACLVVAVMTAIVVRLQDQGGASPSF